MKSRSILIVLFFAFLTITSAKEIEVAAGQGGIGNAYATAEAGDIIVLTTSGGEYIETSTLEITKDITIKAKDGLEVKPTIFTAASFTFSITTGGLNVDGIIFNGVFHGNPITAYPFKIKTPSEINSNDFSLRINNCEIKNFIKSNGKGIFSSDATKSPLDSIIVTNTIFDNITAYAIYLKTTKKAVYPGSYKYLKWENCLITNVFGDDGMVCFIESADKESTDVPTIFINHITAMGMRARGIYVPDVGGTVIQNTIVADVGAGNQDSSLASYAILATKGTNPNAVSTTVQNCLIWESLKSVEADNVIGLLNADPMFADTANGDYTLLSSSPGKSAGTDGLDLGYIPSGLLTSVEKTDLNIPENIILFQNYPNPFNPTTNIQFAIPQNGFVTLKVFNVLGEEVTELINKELVSGTYNVNFDASKLTSGIYFYTLTSGNYVQTKKMMLLE